MKKLFALLLVLLSAPAFAQTTTTISSLPSAAAITGAENIPADQGTCPTCTVHTTSAALAAYTAASANLYPAQLYGACTWSTAGDVGPCVNAAIAAAATAGGGTVVIPATGSGSTSYFGLATPIVNSNSGVRLAGAGVGIPRASNQTTFFLSYTRLLWTGSAGATMALVAPSTNVGQFASGVTGVVFDCNASAAIGLHVSHVSNSTFDAGGAECTSINVLFDTINQSVGPGTQNNTITIRSRTTSGNGTGIMFDKGAGSGFNFSYNHILELYAWTTNGDAIVFGAEDNNVVDQVRTFHQTGGTGADVVVANPAGYTSPNGVTTQAGPTNTQLRFTHSGSQVTVLGYQSGSSITAGTHAGTAAVTSTTISTNATTANNSYVLHFASTTGVVPGMTANCGPAVTGVPPNDPVFAVTGTTVTLLEQTVAAVANPQSCTFSYGIQGSAAVGSYVLTAVDGTHWSTTTVPAGGNSQTNVAIASGALTLTDMVIPFTGTPSANDTFTVVVPTPATKVSVLGVDGSNSKPLAFFEYGAEGQTATSDQPIPFLFNAAGGMALCNMAFTSHCIEPIRGLAITPWTPASASAPCSIGQIAVDTGFIYVCTAANTWKSVAIATF